jgi:monoamine oxidase
MAEGRVRFSPGLPAEKISALENLPLGVADKVIFRLTGDPFGMPPDSFVRGRHDTSRTSSLQIRPFGRDIVSCYFGGRFARELEELGTMVEAARAELVNAFGSKVTQHLTDPLSTAWYLDPDSRGSYSAALPGHGHRRADLAAPLGDRLFFAGEACSPDFFSTCHGGYLSGIAAADAAEAALKKPG